MGNSSLATLTHTMNPAPFEYLLERIREDIASLPLSAVQLVGALIAMQQGLPVWLSSFILELLSERDDMNEVSPAAKALMKIHAFSKHSDRDFARMEIQRQLAFLKLVALDDKVLVATSFMVNLSKRVEEALSLATK